MRVNSLIYSGLFVLLAGGLGACSGAATAPEAPNSFSSDLTGVAAAGSGPTGTTTGVDAQRLRCRADNELTEREIAQIRAWYKAYLVAIAPDVALIDKVNQEAREALQNGATREQIAAILAQADEAKRHVAAATRRLRAAIVDILHDDRLPCFVATVEQVG